MTKKKKGVVLLEELSQEELIAKVNELEQQLTDKKDELKKLKKEPRTVIHNHPRVRGIQM